jgi:hypothetical protein
MIERLCLGAKRQTTVLPLEHGADLRIRNNRCETVIEAVKRKGPAWQEASREAIQKLNQR